MNFSQSPRIAFEQGLLKGLGAPYLLFGRFDCLPHAVIEPIQLTHVSTAAALASDWQKIGIDMQAAIEQYEQADASR